MKTRHHHFHVDRHGTVFDREVFLAMSLAALARADRSPRDDRPVALLDARMTANAVWSTDETVEKTGTLHR
ncbi:hypothetical protein [Parvibaculum sp.]|uniref:hypothetical protein n=1 Tax=Parvibaculum sp. TaxID=2024848 RepID=UPI000C980FC2|nr:hypothetical protein [Parvibaculum sp.]MAB15248.1 hypothetical protein [Parvibaculum sp.]